MISTGESQAHRIGPNAEGLSDEPDGFRKILGDF
jgi:hypothetical protein